MNDTDSPDALSAACVASYAHVDALVSQAEAGRAHFRGGTAGLCVKRLKLVPDGSARKPLQIPSGRRWNLPG